MEIDAEFVRGCGTNGRLIIICGLPGSGKSTLARRLCAGGAAIRMSADEWMDDLGVNLWDRDLRARTESLQWRLTQDLLALGVTVVIEWGTWAREERDALRLQARELGAAVELRYLDVGLEEIWARVHARQMEDPPISKESLAEWLAQFEVPSAEELALFDEH